MEQFSRPSGVYTLYDIKKSLEWGMKPMLDIIPVENVKEFLTKKTDRTFESYRISVIQSLKAVRFEDFTMDEDGKVSFLFDENGRNYRLSYHKLLFREYGKLTGSFLRTEHDSDFFGDVLSDFWEIADAYRTILPDRIESTSERSMKHSIGSSFEVMTQRGRVFVFDPLYPSVVKINLKERNLQIPMDDSQLKYEMVSTDQIPLSMFYLLDRDRLFSEDESAYPAQYQAKHVYVKK